MAWRASRCALTDDVDFAGVRPVLAVAKGPVRGPDAAAMRHGVDVGDEEAALPGLLGADTDGVTVAACSDVGEVVDCKDNGTIILDVSELGSVVTADKVHVAVSRITASEEIPATADVLVSNCSVDKFLPCKRSNKTLRQSSAHWRAG